MKQNDEILKEVGLIISTIQDNKWSEHSEALLLSSQGKLATYLANLSAMTAEANQIQLTLEISAKNKEAEEYLLERKRGSTCEDAKMMARIKLEFCNKEYFEAKQRYEEYRGILNCADSLITAIQVQLRATNREAINASKQNI